jgi:hypothetical protein
MYTYTKLICSLEAAGSERLSVSIYSFCTSKASKLSTLVAAGSERLSAEEVEVSVGVCVCACALLAAVLADERDVRSGPASIRQHTSAYVCIR